ncbi:hypothetical protein HKD37_03G007832 [Glycine soja]
MHSVTYNQDDEPNYTGWMDRTHKFLWSHTRSSSDHDPFCQSIFFLAIFKSSSKPEAYPKWHSLYHQIPNSVTFKVLLNEYKNVSSTMYSFMKATGFTHLNLKGITECRIIYNHWRKSAKIAYGWKTFAQSQNL